MITELDENIHNTNENIFKINNSIISKLNNLIIQNNLIFENYFPSIIEKTYKELSFLNCKRYNPNNSENNNKGLLDMNEKSMNFYLNEKVKSEFNLIKNFKSTKIFYIYKNYSKNKDIDIFNSNKKYQIEKSNSIFINKNENCLKKKNIENTMENVSGSIKIKSNHKLIYINKSLLKQKNKKNEGVVEKRKRSSLYRGVSKNGNNWQVIINSKYNKGYIGVYKTQEIAGRIYDIISIKNKGIKAKTNFEYNIHQIQNIIDSYIDYNADNIEEIISDLIKN